MANSGTVTAGSAALASQYNNLRADVLNISTGHTHTGASENGAKVEGTALKATGVTDGYGLFADGSGGVAWEAVAAAGADVQEFTSSGSWVKPAGKSAVYVLAVGGGGGGGGGGRVDTGNAIGSGGCGGAGANHLSQWFKASELGGTVTVTIGAGGAGGTGVPTEVAGTEAATGGTGASGGDTTFGTAVVAKGGKGGLFGYASNYVETIAQSLGSPLTMTWLNSSSTDTVGAGLSTTAVLYSGTVTYDRYLAGLGVGMQESQARGYASADNQQGCAGGGGGGGRNGSTPATGAGGYGGRGFGLKANAATVGGNAGGTASATAGASAGTATPYLGNGGAGGGGANGDAGVYNGGAGGAGVRGGGGGGGGGVKTTTNNVTSGRGGAGGGGYMLVISV